jgi:hypothetical protein
MYLSESETTCMYLCTYWEKHFLYSFCLRVKPHLTLISECPFVSVKRDVSACLRAKFQYAFSLSTYFVGNDIDAHSCITKATNTLNILVVTWKTVYNITFRVFTYSYVGGFHVSKEHDASLLKFEGLCQILTLKRYIRCLEQFSLGAASHWSDFSVQIAPTFTKPDYTVAERRKLLLTVGRLFLPLRFV